MKGLTCPAQEGVAPTVKGPALLPAPHAPASVAVELGDRLSRGTVRQIDRGNAWRHPVRRVPAIAAFPCRSATCEPGGAKAPAFLARRLFAGVVVPSGGGSGPRAVSAAGRFRDDLFARLNLWTFTLPGLAERREDIEPNLDFELDRFAMREGTRVTLRLPLSTHTA